MERHHRAEEFAATIATSSPGTLNSEAMDEHQRAAVAFPEHSAIRSSCGSSSVRDQAHLAPVLAGLAAELAAKGIEPDGVVRRLQGRQAANQVTVGNCVLGLRLLAAIDWNSFFERNFSVEAVLRTDPAGAYAQQEFATSDRYRQAVEWIARGSEADELVVAKTAVELAPAQRFARDHVGYYLIDRGEQAELKARLGYRPLLARTGN